MYGMCFCRQIPDGARCPPMPDSERSLASPSCAVNATMDDPPGTERLAPVLTGSATDASTELVQCFEGAVTRLCAETLDSLRSAAIACGAEMRARGLPPGHAVSALKARIRGRHPSAWSPSLVESLYTATPPPEADVYRRLFGWWIAGYYERAP